MVHPKPIVLVDGNQPGLGKTLLVRVISIVLDGCEPPILSFTPDEEELQKRLCATLRGSCQTVLLMDNAKCLNSRPISSPVIEAQSQAPEVSLRILSKSQNFNRPNDLLWAMTMNDTRTSPDLVSRGLPVRLHFAGRPEERIFQGPDPLDYGHVHRLDILGELAGMIIHWNQAGRPQGTCHHRLSDWAGIVGGIVQAAGFPEFLANAQAAAASFDTTLDELAAVYETIITGGGPFIVLDESPMGENQ